MVIERNTDFTEPYYNRGMTLVLLQNWEKAKEDLAIAREKQENIFIELFREDFGDVADFEQNIMSNCRKILSRC